MQSQYFYPEVVLAGDTLTVQRFDKYAARETCFPKLPNPARVKSNLTKELSVDDVAISGGTEVQAKHILDAAIGASYKNVKGFQISFTNVDVDETPINDLETGADLGKCPFLESILAKTVVTPDKVLANMVVYGSRQISVNLEKKISGQGNATAVIDKIAALLSFKGKVEAKYDDMWQSTIAITDENPLPIAFRSAFVSTKDIQLRAEQMKKGYEKSLAEAWRLKNRDLAARVLEADRNLAIRPEQIKANMFSGSLTQLLPRETAQHRDYIRFVTLHLLASSLYYKEDLSSPEPRLH
jgi:hypothetical protein